MKNNFKKILAFFLAALVCLSTFPMSVLAVEAEVETVMPGCPECDGHPNDKVEPTGKVNETATCTEAAGVWYICANDHKSTGDGPLEFIKPYEGSKALHSDETKVVKTDAVAATHTTDGNSAYWYCGACDTYYSDFPCKTPIAEGAWVIEANANAHVWSDWTTDFDYVCGGADGQESRECTDPNCDATETQAIPAQPHIWVEKEVVGGETCMDDGHIIFECDREGCDAEDKLYFANGWNHVLVKTDAKGATCTTVGEAAYWTCTLCGKFFSDANGENEIEENSWVGVYGHEFNYVPGNAPTCTEEGNIPHFECEICGDKYAFDLNDGQAKFDNVTIPALGHTTTVVEANAPTCTEEGNEEYYYCDACDGYFWDENGEIEITFNDNDTYVIPADGHNMTHNEADPATCNKPGTIENYYCDACNSYFADENGVTELDFIEAPIMVPNADGERTLEEIGPDDERYEFFAGEQHNWRVAAVKDPTCTLKGWLAWVCDDCDAYTGSDAYNVILAPTAHSAITEDDIVPAVHATCVSEGMYAYAQCPDCEWYFWVNAEGYVLCGAEDAFYTDADLAVLNPFIEPVDSKNHAGTPKVVCSTVEADCYTIGYNEFTLCLGCMNAYQVINGEVVNYAWSNDFDYSQLDGYTPAHTPVYVDAVEPDCNNDGNIAYFNCVTCNKKYEAIDENTIKTVYDEENDRYLYVEIDNVVILGGHNYGEEIAATYNCGFDGYAAHYYCVDCQTYFNADKVAVDSKDDLFVEATGAHETFNIVKEVIKCDKDGKGEAGLEKCAECGFEKTIDPHTYTDRDYLTIQGTNEPTCTEIGHYALKCDFCQTYERTEDGTAIKIYEADKKAHTDYGTPVFVQYKDSTCFVPGNKAYYQCNGCGQKFSSAAMLDTDAKAFDDEGNYIEGWEIIAPAHGQINGIDEVAERVDVCGTVIVDQYVCLDCGYYSVDGEGDSTDWQEDLFTELNANAHHSELVPNNDYVAPDCLNNGHKATVSCPDCKAQYIVNVILQNINDDESLILVENENDVVIPALDHNGTFSPYVAPTCTEVGQVAYFDICSNGCGKMYFAADPTATELVADATIKSQIGDVLDAGWIFIEANGHTQTPENTVPAIVPHCELDEEGNPYVVEGNDAYYTCDDCGKIFADGEIAPLAEEKTEDDFVLTHESNFEKTDVKASTCTEKGYYKLSCECGLEYYQYTAPLGHTVTIWDAYAREATCSVDGNKEHYYCGTCHVIFKDADCTNPYTDDEGNAVVLVGDAAVKEFIRIPATGIHVNAAGDAITAGCDNGAFVWDAENNVWVENVIDRFCVECATDFKACHQWVEGSVNQSCLYPASTYKVCSVCHNINENTRIVDGEPDPEKHSTLSEVINSDKNVHCDDDAKAWKVCDLCGQQVGDTYAKEHNIVENEELRVEGTCMQNGTAYYYCTECNYTYSETIVRPEDHSFEGANWVVNGAEKDYTSAQAEVRYCIYGCGTAQYRAHQDVNFSIEMDSAIKSGAVLVNSGKVAVTVKISAYQKVANYFTFSFEYSDNLIFDSVVFSDTAKAFGMCDGGVQVIDGANVCTLNTFRYQATDFTIDGQDIVYATIYFTIADDAQNTNVELKNLKVADLADVNGEPVEASVGEALTEYVYMLGDMNDDGKITAADMRAIANIAASNGYDARADVDKSGSVKPVDVTATQKCITGNYNYDKLIHPENR